MPGKPELLFLRPVPGLSDAEMVEWRETVEFLILAWLLLRGDEQLSELMGLLTDVPAVFRGVTPLGLTLLCPGARGDNSSS